MRTLLWVLLILDQLFLLIVGAVDLNRYALSDFQIKETYEGKHDARSKLMRRLHKNLPYVRRQQQLELTLAFTVSVTLWTYLLDPVVLGVVWVLLMALILMILRRFTWVQHPAYQLFERMLELILTISLKLKPLWWAIGLPPKQNVIMPSSAEELADVMSHTAALAQEEKERLQLVLEVSAKTAKNIMTPARKVTHVTPGATLGPVLLADLEKSGHGYFPVINKQDGVVGMLSLKQVADISSAKSHNKVADIMSEDVIWVPADLPVLEVAQMFLSAKQYVLLVQNEEQEFAGLLTIADLLKHTLAIH